MRVGVLGAGNGGLAAAADLSLRSHEVRLWEHPDFKDRLVPIREKGGIELTGTLTGFARPTLVTEDVGAAVRNAEVILIIVPAFGQQPVARHLASHIAADQPVIVNPGSTGGAVEVARILRAAGHRGPVAETTMLTYSCRTTAPATVYVTHVPRVLHLAAFPADETPVVLETARALFPFLQPATDVLETGLNNINPVIHLPIGLCNAGRIEAQAGEFYFFREGLTPSVARLHQAMDAERVELLGAFGYPPMTALEYMQAIGYVDRADEWHRAVQTSEMYCGRWAFKAPSSLSHRFFVEDVGYNLITWLDLARIAGVAMPVTEAICRLVSILNGVDYRAQGTRTVSALGLDGRSPAALRRSVQCR